MNLIRKFLTSVSVFVKFCSTTDLSPTTKFIKSNSFKKSLKKQHLKSLSGEKLVSISGKEIFDQYSSFRAYDLSSLSGLKSIFEPGSKIGDLSCLFKNKNTNPGSPEELEGALFERLNPLLTTLEVDKIVDYFSEEYSYFKKELDFVIRYDIYNKHVNSKLSDSKKTMVLRFQSTFFCFVNFFKTFLFVPVAEKILGSEYINSDTIAGFQKDSYQIKLLFAYIVSHIQKYFQSKGYTDETDLCPIDKWNLVNVLEDSLYQYAFHLCWKEYAKLNQLPDVSLPLYFGVMEYKKRFFFKQCISVYLETDESGYEGKLGSGYKDKSGSAVVSLAKAADAANLLANKYIFKILTCEGQLMGHGHNIARRCTGGNDWETDSSYSGKPMPMAAHSSLGVKLPYLRQSSDFKTGEKFDSLSRNTKKVMEVLHSTSFFIDPIFINVVSDILDDQGKILYSEESKVNSLDALKKHSAFIEIEKVLNILKRVLSGTRAPKTRRELSSKFRKGQVLTIARKAVKTKTWQYFTIYSQNYFFNLPQKDWNFVLETRKKLNSFSQVEEQTQTARLLTLFSKILVGYKLFFRYTLDWRLRVYSGTTLFSKDSGIFKFSVCGPILSLTQVGFLALFQCYFSYGDNSKVNCSRIEKCFKLNSTLSLKKKILLVKKCFDSLKYVKLNSPNYLRSKFLENTVIAALNTAKTGFLMPLDQKNSVWMFVGLFFRNSKILSLTSVIQNEYKMDLIQYLQSQNEGFSEIVLRTQKKSKFFKENDVNTNELVANSIRKFIKLFSEKRSLHKGLSMFSVFGQMAAGRVDQLKTLVQKELKEDLTKEDLEALGRVAGGYNEFLNKYLDGIITHINSFKQLSKQYFKFKFLYLKTEIEAINKKLKDNTSLEEYEVKELESELKTLEKDQALYFKNVNGDLIYHQETIWFKSGRDRHSVYSACEKIKKTNLMEKYTNKIKADSKEAAHQMPSAMVHSMEAAVLHDVILKLDEKGIRINHCHDCYQIHPNFYTIFFEVMSDVYGKQFGSASTFWDLSTILVNREGIYWLEDPVLSPEQRLELEKMMANFMKSFSFTMDSSWTFKNVKECYVFDR